MSDDPERDAIRDRDLAVMDRIRDRFGEGALFFHAMRIATENLVEYDKKKEVVNVHKENEELKRDSS